MTIAATEVVESSPINDLLFGQFGNGVFKILLSFHKARDFKK